MTQGRHAYPFERVRAAQRGSAIKNDVTNMYVAVVSRHLRGDEQNLCANKMFDIEILIPEPQNDAESRVR